MLNNHKKALSNIRWVSEYGRKFEQADIHATFFAWMQRNPHVSSNNWSFYALLVWKTADQKQQYTNTLSVGQANKENVDMRVSSVLILITETQIKAWMHYQAQALLPWVAHLHCYLHFSIKKKRNVLSQARSRLHEAFQVTLMLTFHVLFLCSANSFLLPKKMKNEDKHKKSTFLQQISSGFISLFYAAKLIQLS